MPAGSPRRSPVTRFAFVLALAVPAVAFAAPVPKEGDAGVLLVSAGGEVTRMNPDGSDAEALFRDKYAGDDFALGPAGKRMGYLKHDWWTRNTTVGVRTADGERVPLLTVDDRVGRVVWSADGKSLYCCVHPDGMPVTTWKCCAIDVATGKRTTFGVPAGAELVGVAPTTGDLILTIPGGADGLATVTTPPTKYDPTEAIPAKLGVEPLAAFPDGKRWLVRANGGVGLYTAGEKAVAAWEKAANVPVGAVRPDGKRVAYIAAISTRDFTPPTYELWTADPDGTNAKKVTESDKPVTRVEWR